MKKTRSFLQQVFAFVAASPHIVWAILFIIAPLLFVFYYAFTNGDGGFTWINVTTFFTQGYWKIFLRSLRYAVIATLICLLIGYPIAYFISRCKPKTQRILILLLMLPMWMNFLIRTYAIMVLIQDTGIINSFLGIFGIGPIHMIETEGAVILGMVYDYLPYMILPIYSVMAKLDYRLVEAAADLGCNGFAVLRKVIFPLSLSGVISGVTNWGIYVELPNTVEGIIHLENIEDDFYRFDAERYQLVGKHFHKVYRLGQHITIMVLSVDKLLKTVDFLPFKR